MHRSIPVWQTLSESFVFVAQHLGMLIQALIIPLLLTVGLEIVFLSFVHNLQSSLYMFKALIDLIIYAWMINIACRVVITQHSTASRWTSGVSWTVVWLLCLTLVITLLSGAVAVAVFGTLAWVNGDLAISLGLMTFIVMHIYLFARFVLVFPATAMGDKASFREAWEMSSGNGWRLVMLFFLVPLIYALIAAIFGMLLPFPFFQSILTIISIFFCLVGVVAVSMAYKQLKTP